MELTKRRQVCQDRHADYWKSPALAIAQPAEGRCDDCHRLVALPNFTNTCVCGAEYNWAGQRLGRRADWGIETNEHPTDIARIK